MSSARGTTPRGASGEQQAAAWVRGMFGRVAGRYDLLNHLLSLNADRYWRARTVRRLAGRLNDPSSRVMDLCCGTGDLLLALEARRGAPAIGCDFCHPMLLEARRKQRGRASLLVEGDALRLPFPDGSLDLITVAFGLRNFANYAVGLAELRRVLAPGGMLAILEFSQPPNRLIAAAYRFYSMRVLPKIGGWISGAPDAYQYLPESVARFPSAEGLAEAMREAGFGNVAFELFTCGVVALHTGIAR
jgi:demethylmenaquinone methyltransferase/2-methoxy-6-polyprenyl-1,4-benzoquinol methylase